MSASPAPVLDQFSDTIIDPSIQSTSTGTLPSKSTSGVNGKSSELHTGDVSQARTFDKQAISRQPPLTPAQPKSTSTSSPAINAIAGPSSTTSAISAKVNQAPSSSKPSPTGSKHKPIIIEEREEGEISEDDDEIIAIDPVPKGLPTSKRPQSPIRTTPNRPVSPQPPRPLSQRVSPAHPIPSRHVQPPSGPAAMNNSRLTKNQRKKQEKRARLSLMAQKQQSVQNRQPPSQHQRHQPPPSPLPPIPINSASPAQGKGKGKEREKETEKEEEAEVSLELNDSVGPAAADLSAEEAEQYIDIIRNLITEGVSPDTLVQRGATPEYVMKVCQEIVEGTKKRKALWLETREQPRADSEAPSIAPPPGEAENKSPSPEIEVTVNQNVMSEMDRINSNDSDAIIPVERMTVPFSQHPQTINSTTTQSIHKATQPVKIESYKPGQSSASSILPPTAPRSHLSPMPIIPTSSVAFTSTNSISNLSTTASEISNQHRGKKQWDGGLSAGSDILLDYNSDDVVVTQIPDPPLSAKIGSVNPFAILDTTPLTPSFSPPPPEPIAPPPPAPPPEQTLQATLLETRRKAMESMRRRRAAVPKPITTVPVSTAETVETTVTTVSTPSVDEEAAEIQRSIEEQMADLEKEVLEAAAVAQGPPTDPPAAEVGNGEQAEEEQDQMDLDEPEEGEIMPSEIPTSTPEPLIPPFIGSASLPVRPPRGVKRLHAEDLNENKATSLPSRTLPPAKRRPFGATQRVQRLILHLDDDSDSDSSVEDDNQPIMDLDFTSNSNEVDIIERQRMLEEKESSIRKLKEQIAAKMAARKRKAEDTNGSGSGGGTPMEKTVSLGTAEVIRNVLQPDDKQNVGEATIPADVQQLTKELVQAEAEVEAMDVDLAPSVPWPSDAVEVNVIEDPETGRSY
ncbi:uncharacterized protein L201_000619 [Kwoniella dendrophila CBS 6074]|uniref:Uncharacterized protein n=1 Tax=Kwoniella dendrophila CBS 6074 TaxID=1295534 RepID=A0AAX4JMX3_9TREE